LKGKYNKIPAIYSLSLQEMVDNLLIKDYRQRPDIEQILRHPAMVERMKKLSIELPSVESLKIAPKKGKEPIKDKPKMIQVPKV
jgi:hypothetical protein